MPGVASRSSRRSRSRSAGVRRRVDAAGVDATRRRGPMPVRSSATNPRPATSSAATGSCARRDGEFVLLLDDDTRLFSRDEHRAGARRCCAPIPASRPWRSRRRRRTARPWPERHAAVARRDVPCVVASFIGFAHLLRRDVFLELGGYREAFVFYGEEKEFCLRLLDAGHQTVYLPDALRRARAGSGRPRSPPLPPAASSRNDCLNALYNDPLAAARSGCCPRGSCCTSGCAAHWQIARSVGRLAWLRSRPAGAAAGVLAGPAARCRARRSRAWRALRNGQTAYEPPRLQTGSAPAPLKPAPDDRPLVRRGREPPPRPRDGAGEPRPVGRHRRRARRVLAEICAASASSRFADEAEPVVPLDVAFDRPPASDVVRRAAPGARGTGTSCTAGKSPTCSRARRLRGGAARTSKARVRDVPEPGEELPVAVQRVRALDA